MQDYPTLCAAGLGISNFRPPREEALAQLARQREVLENGVDAVDLAVAFLRRCDRVKTPTLGSYPLKHVAEEWNYGRGTPTYVANGALIAASLMLGLAVRPYDPRALRLECLGCSS